jgi:type I restriction enzyme S subunit
MSEILTKGTWTKVTLAQCCKEIAQRIDNPSESGFERFVGLEHLETGETSIQHWGSTDDVTSSMKLFKTGDVIVARRNVYLRRAARADFDGVCSGDGIVLRGNPEICLPELLSFLLNTDNFWNYVISQADGTMSKRITVNRLMAYEFTLPPLEEQRRIAEALMTLEQTEQGYLGITELSTQVYRSVLDNFFGHDFKARGEHAPTSSRGLLWPVNKLGNLAEIRFSNVDKKADPSEPPVELCNYMDVYLNDQITSAIEFMAASASQKEIEIFQIQEGDVLVTKDSEDPLDIGVPALVLDSLDNVICGYHLAIVRPDRKRLNPLFLTHYLRSTRAKCYLYQMAQGVTRFGLTNPAIRSFPIPLPLIEEQEKLATLFDRCRNAGSVSQQKSSDIRVQKFRFLNQKLGVLNS